MKHIYFLTLLALGAAFSASAQLTSTNLPIIKITTGGVPIADTQVQAGFVIINNASGTNTPSDPPQFDGMAGVMLRGSGTYPKKGYYVETWTGFKLELDTTLLGMPTENDWDLMDMYTDRSLMRSLIGYHLFEGMGNYSPRMQLCELMVDGAYQGVYLFGEKIKRDTFRLDIAKLKNTDNTYPDVSGGYIFKIDDAGGSDWTSSYLPPFASGSQTIGFHDDYPEDNDISGIQQDWIHDYVDSFEDAMNSAGFQDTTTGWRNYASHKSMCDFFIVNEVLGNEEAYRLNTYMWKDMKKKMRFGPVWNMNLCLYATANCNADQDTSWMYHHGETCGTDAELPPFWWYRVQSDTDFVQEVKCKYSEWRMTGNILDTAVLFAYMDSVSTRLNAAGAQTRNFTLYPIYGTPLVNEPMPMATTYDEEVANMKTYMRNRLTFLDAQWLTTTGCDTTTGVAGPSNPISQGSVYPNPASTHCTAGFYLYQSGNVTVSATNMLGETVYIKKYDHLPAGYQNLNIETASWPTGVYTISLKAEDGHSVSLKLAKH